MAKFMSNSSSLSPPTFNHIQVTRAGFREARNAPLKPMEHLVSLSKPSFSFHDALALTRQVQLCGQLLRVTGRSNDDGEVGMGVDGNPVELSWLNWLEAWSNGYAHTNGPLISMRSSCRGRRIIAGFFSPRGAIRNSIPFAVLFHV